MHFEKWRARSMRGVGLAAFSLGLLAGCDTYAANRYSINADTVVALRRLEGRTIGVGQFSSAAPGQREITCRAVGPIKTPDGEPFADYVRKAFTDEMKIAGVYAESSPVQITGRLDEIDLGSASGTWRLVLTLTSSNGNRLTAAETYKFTSSFVATTACQEAAKALMPAVQNLVGQAVRDPAFRRLVVI